MLYHVGVVPMSRTMVRGKTILIVSKPLDNGVDTVPRIIDIGPISPQVAGLCDGSVIRFDLGKFLIGGP